jgi:uncharacterized HAD superfamily protein
MKKIKKIIAVDIDGVLTRKICWTVKECENAEPNWILIKLVNDYYKDNEIVIYTARKLSFKKATIKWLKKHGVKYHRFGQRKMVYDLLIDDHTFNPMDYDF